MSLWGPLKTRYETPRPRKLLVLDGGSIRGILTLEVLVRMEQLLAQATGRGREFRLCEFVASARKFNGSISVRSLSLDSKR